MRPRASSILISRIADSPSLCVTPPLFLGREGKLWVAGKSSPNLWLFRRQVSVFEEKSGVEQQCLRQSVVRLFCPRNRREMIGNGGWRRWGTAWPDINDRQYRGIIPPIQPILEQCCQYWSRKSKALQENDIQTLSPPGPTLYCIHLLQHHWHKYVQ